MDHHHNHTHNHTHDHDLDHDHSHENDTNHSMPMYFNFMYPITVLFQEWKITEEEALIGSCFAVLGIAIGYEFLKAFRQWNQQKLFLSLRRTMSTNSQKREINVMQMRSMDKTFWIHHSMQSALHSVQNFLGYALMLIVMTFNVWLLVATAVGAGIGYMLGDGILTVEENEGEQAVFDSFGEDSSEHSSRETSFGHSNQGYMKCEL